MFTTSIRKLDQNRESHVFAPATHTINRKQSGTNTKERLNFPTSVSSQKLGKHGCCALGLNALCLAHLRCWCRSECACGTSSVQQGGLVTELQRAEREREGGRRGGCQTELETRGGKMMGYIFAREFWFFWWLWWGGELFRDSNEQGGLSTARRADDCRSLVRCLFSSFLFSTSLPACVHGLWLIKNRLEMTTENSNTHTHTSYLHITAIRSVVGLRICSNIRRDI